MTSGMAEAVTTPDGRRLAYLEVGDPHGPLVLHNNGGRSSRLEARLLGGAAAKNGLRFVCVDRPGMGQYSPQKARSYAAWADDLVTIADALGGHSRCTSPPLSASCTPRWACQPSASA